MNENHVEVRRRKEEGTCTHCTKPNFPWEGKESVSELFEVNIGSQRSSSRQQVFLCRHCLTDLMMQSIAALRSVE